MTSAYSDSSPAAHNGPEALFDLLEMDAPIRCADCGAMPMRDTRDPWFDLAESGLTEVIGFEPVPEACRALNAAASRPPSVHYLPHALGDGLEHTLYITNVPMTSSLFRPASSTVSLFQNLEELMVVEREERLTTVRLDDIPELRPLDFLKLDIQGAELMALQHGLITLEAVSVVQCEVEFVELYEGQPLFAEVDSFMRTQGFSFLRFGHTMGRPFKPLRHTQDENRSLSQLLWADAIYVRDFRRREHWSTWQLKAAAAVTHLFYHGFDLSHLLIAELDRRDGGARATRYLSQSLGIETG